MHCPSCNNIQTRVVDTREQDDGLVVRRRRSCEQCSHRFSTSEYLEILHVVVIKRDGRRVPYSRDNVESGVRRSLEKRPYTHESFNALMRVIERDIQKNRQKEIPSEKIGSIVMKHLKQFDKVAYVRFASVYLHFSDVGTFVETAHSLS